MKRKSILFLAFVLACVMCCGCNSKGKNKPDKQEGVKPRENTIVAKIPVAAGTVVYEGENVSVDASNLSEGYVMVRYTGENEKVRMLFTGPSGTEYNYRLRGGEYEAFPLSDGNGNYHLAVYENTQGSKYALVYSTDIEAQMTDEKQAFLYANQYVKFTENSAAVKKGAELAKGKTSDLEVVEEIYHFVAETISYDHEEAASVVSGYLPDVDEVLATKKGICFDYAALMCAMLRTQRIPTKLEIGYREEEYHAWISVYIEEEGWIDNIILFNGKEWKLMDPTLAAGARDATVKKYMNDSGKLYQLKFKY